MASSGLANVIAGKSAISTVGLGGGLNYRGFNINELAQLSSFEETAFLLLFGHLPNQLELGWVRRTFHNSRKLSQNLRKALGNYLVHTNILKLNNS